MISKLARIKVAGIAQDAADYFMSCVDEYEIRDEYDLNRALIEILQDGYGYEEEFWNVAKEYVNKWQVADLFWDEFRNDVLYELSDKYEDIISKHEAKIAAKKIARCMESKLVASNKRNRTARKKVSGWRGHPNIEMEYYNEWADPSLIYKDHKFNYWDMEGALWDMFVEEQKYDKGIDEERMWDGYDLKPEFEHTFDRYVQDNAEGYFDDVMWGGYFQDGSKDWRDRYSKRDAHKSRISRRDRIARRNAS